ncbi:hypothetical protein AWB80_05551 [Caballeronia pedi]|uniref:Transmembrane protein n=1 Tax=Caballeronia pedi TaxID=1777141 RepID=A0A158CN61_9BURK|nr:hypothetical protein [Caballeronia pedi]SAK83814.1 hypothetical protein AWB80_05551 [Caballeronia pedi]
MSIASSENVKRLPPGLFAGATRLQHNTLTGEEAVATPWEIGQILGVRRINDQCVELQTADSTGNRELAAGWVGRSMEIGIFGSLFWLSFLSGRSALVMALISPLIFTVIGLLVYLFSGARRNRGTFIRLHRGTRKLYYVAPGQEELLTLDFDRLVPMAGFMPLLASGVYTTRHPLFLVGLDTIATPPCERCIVCGNLGWRDDGQSAKQLWDYLQRFMEDGPHGLTPPPPVPRRDTRTQAFTRQFHEWSAKFREDLPTAKSRWRSPWLVFWKVFWLIAMVFPDSLADWLQYNVPYTRFPKQIDELCDMPSPRVDNRGIDE